MSIVLDVFNHFSFLSEDCLFKYIAHFLLGYLYSSSLSDFGGFVVAAVVCMIIDLYIASALMFCQSHANLAKILFHFVVRLFTALISFFLVVQFCRCFVRCHLSTVIKSNRMLPQKNRASQSSSEQNKQCRENLGSRSQITLVMENIVASAQTGADT